jgi:hypothetical protein
MKKPAAAFFLLFAIFHKTTAQNIGISTNTPGGKLQINHRNTASSPALILHDSSSGTGSAIRFSKQTSANTFSIVSTNDAFAANSSLDLRTTLFSGIFLRGDRRVGIDNITNPLASLHVGGGVKIADTLNVTNDMNIGGKLKINGEAGSNGQVLISTGSSSDPEWSSLSGIAGGNVGYGVWGDCAANGNISGYNPVVDTNIASVNLFGVSVAISGSFAIVGSRGDQIGANANQGSATILQYNGTNWVHMQKLVDATGGAGDSFGISVSISGNYAIVGAHFDDVGANDAQGSVSIFQYNGASWVLMQKITDPAGAANDFFGMGVSISGNHAIVGSPGVEPSNRGSVLFYQYNGASWVLVLKTFTNSLAVDDMLGTSVSISGNFAVAGSPGYNSTADNQGAANVYQYNGSTWILTQTLVDANGLANDKFGKSVSIADDHIIVGAPDATIASGNRRGAAIIFRYNGSSWMPVKRLIDPTGDVSYDFGSGVSVSGSYAIVGSSGDDRLGGNQGSSIIYQRIGTSWQKMQLVTDPGGESGDTFGAGVGLDGSSKRFIIGAPGFEGSGGKVVFGKIN